jgi:transposase
MDPSIAITPASGKVLAGSRLHSIDPLAWLTDVLQRIVSGQTKNQGLHALLPWNWHSRSTAVTA